MRWCQTRHAQLVERDRLMCSDVKQWFVVSAKNIHATINIEKSVLLKIRK